MTETIPAQERRDDLGDDVVASFAAFQREKARKEKVSKALKDASEEEQAAFKAWQAEQAAKAAAEAEEKAREATAAAWRRRRKIETLREKAIPSPDEPMAVGRYLQPTWEQDGVFVLRRWRDMWMRWNGALWSELKDSDMRAWLYKRLEHEVFIFVDGRSGIESERPWAPTSAKINNLTDAIAAITNLSSDIDAPNWTDGRASSGLIVPCRNGLLDLATRKLSPTTPAYFNTHVVDIDYDPNAPEPTEWLAFLHKVWPDDPDAIATLQEMFGYVLSGRRDLQKIFFFQGPTRSGKGTIAGVLRSLVGGEAHTAGVTLAKFGRNFGLASLIGKPLAIIPDARMPRDPEGIVENLLMISGQDVIDIDRKHKEAWTGRLPTQLILMSNELPKLTDASAAIAGRFVILKMVESFLGREDFELAGKLERELAGIFNWSLVGLDRLTERGRFKAPKSSAEAAELLSDRASPVKQFLDEVCELVPTESILVDDLWKEWQRWCAQNGRDKVGTKNSFGIDLYAAAPKVRRTKPRAYPGGPQVPTYEGIRLA